MRNKKQGGVSLIELLISLSIVAILSAQIPAIQFSLARSKANTASDELQRILQFARLNAVSRAREITLCPSIDRQCNKTWSATSSFIVFIDKNENRRLDDTEQLLREVQVKHGSWAWRASGGRDYLRFSYDGSVKEIGSYYYCHFSDDRLARQITVNRQGRSYRSKDKDGDFRHEHNTRQGELSCS